VGGDSRSPETEPSCEFQGRVGFVLGTGRSGTHFMARLLDREPAVAAWHERHPMADAFHRYCAWHGLPVDSGGFLATKERGIRSDLADHEHSIESSSYLSLSVPELHARFGARFLLLTRSPDRVVCSFEAKGWYETTPARDDPKAIVGYQPDPIRPHHPFSRLAPIGEEALAWNELTPIGKLGWFWSKLHESCLGQLNRLPRDQWRVERLENFDYSSYRAVTDFFGVDPQLSEQEFGESLSNRPESKRKSRTVASWSDAEAGEFEEQVRPMSERLGYEWRVDVLRSTAPASRRPQRRGVVRTLLGLRS
jgi:hypothetical protein